MCDFPRHADLIRRQHETIARAQKVRGEINRRISQHQPENKYHYLSSKWVDVIKKYVLHTHDDGDDIKNRARYLHNLERAMLLESQAWSKTNG